MSGRRKSARAFFVEIDCQLCGRKAADFGELCGGQCDTGGLVHLAAEGMRGEIGAVGFDQEAVERAFGPATSRSGSSALLVKVIIPANERCNPNVQIGLCVIPRPCERVHYAADRATELLQLLDDVVLAVAAMDHDRKVVLVGEGQVSIEPCLLFGERGAVPVAVEAGFSDGDDAWTPDHFQDARPVLLADFGRLVGVDADGGEDSADGCSASSSDPALEAAVVPIAMIWETPSLAARSRMAGKVGAQSSVVQVSVGIDQWAGAGRSGSGESCAEHARGAGGFELGFRALAGAAAIPSRQLPFHSWAA